MRACTPPTPVTNRITVKTQETMQNSLLLQCISHSPSQLPICVRSGHLMTWITRNIVINETRNIAQTQEIKNQDTRNKLLSKEILIFLAILQW